MKTTIIYLLIALLAVGLCYLAEGWHVRYWHKQWTPFFGHEHLDVPNDEKIGCMQWAVGDDFASIARESMADRWRDLHPDIPIVYDSDNWETFYMVVAQEWKKHKDHGCGTSDDTERIKAAITAAHSLDFVDCNITFEDNDVNDSIRIIED